MIWERSHASFISVELLSGTPISSALRDSEERKRCSTGDDIEEDEELPLLAMSTV
ncbi:hypothetical protein OIU79_026092, partial [Salix purpurea]